MKRWILLLILFMVIIIYLLPHPVIPPKCIFKIINITEKDYNYTSLPPIYRIITNESVYYTDINSLETLKIGINSANICNNEIRI